MDLLGSILGSMEKPPSLGDAERKKARGIAKTRDKLDDLLVLNNCMYFGCPCPWNKSVSNACLVFGIGRRGVMSDVSHV